MLINILKTLFEKYLLKCAMILDEDTPLVTFTLPSRNYSFFYNEHPTCPLSKPLFHL